MRQDDGPDWLFIGGITVAIASVIVFAGRRVLRSCHRAAALEGGFVIAGSILGSNPVPDKT